MAIEIVLKELLRNRGVTAKELARRINITEANLSRLATGRSSYIRFELLNAICKELSCQPGDVLRYRPSSQPGKN